jgi:hypothetical protein
MSLPTENIVPFVLGGSEDGTAVLDSDKYRDMRWCANCAGEQVFVEVFEFESGRVGVCLGCGQERVIPFSRVNGKTA